ncbi:MAG: hypothetical protein JST70_01975 [Bacteroidetes bacterium]|nr:hypothetical protein [Bacteroidota bacterium]
MISIHTSKVDNILSVVLKSDIDKFIQVREKSLGDLIDGKRAKKSTNGRSSKPKLLPKLTGKKLEYATLLKDNLSKIVLAHPSELTSWKNKFDAIISQLKINDKIYKPFKNQILSCLDYEGLRSDFYPQYFSSLGIKSCVYCNALLTVSVESTITWMTPQRKQVKTKKEWKAKFQVDHYIPKSDYPCFGISFYNLYPVCGPCNNIKLDRVIGFMLYLEGSIEFEDSPFLFELEDGCVSSYLNTNNIELIKFRFLDNNNLYQIKDSVGKTRALFDIQGIYDTQKDVIAELILKAKKYPTSYKESLINSFSGLFSDASLSNRLLIGNYSQPSEIHNRPLAKFTQDIAKQLKLI